MEAHSRYSDKRRPWRALTLSLCAMALCMAVAFDAHAGPTANQGVLINTATLQDWIEEGYFGGMKTCGEVVLLDVTDPGSYSAGHIPGAQLWNVADQVQERLEGPAEAVNMVLDGPNMDAMLQTHGIDEDTTIIITSSKPPAFPARAYFLLRYWGFPRKQIKVLDGFNGAWDLHDKTTLPTKCPESDYSVKDRGIVRTEERASLNEMIAAVRFGTGVAVDMRGNKSAAKSTPGVIPLDVAPPDQNDYVVFEGTPIGGRHFKWTGFFNVDDKGVRRFKPAHQIKAALIESGIDGSTPVLSYCRTGYLASVGYLVLDGILGDDDDDDYWDVMTYDGSWAQWGKMSYDAARGGELPSESLWAVDSVAYMEVINYNADAGWEVETLNLKGAAHDKCPSPFDRCANNIENDDRAYVQEDNDDDDDDDDDDDGDDDDD